MKCNLILKFGTEIKITVVSLAQCHIYIQGFYSILVKFFTQKWYPLLVRSVGISIKPN